MPRYIDVEKAIKAIDDLPNCYNGYSDTYDKAYIIGTLEEVPTADVVEVVRCKDCKHNSLKRMTGNAFCELGIGLSQIYDFCSRGERRETDATLH